MTTDPTPQQQAIIDAVDNLRAVLADVVPWTTIHYAVEQLRGPLRVLRREAPQITTHDRIHRPTPTASTPAGRNKRRHPLDNNSSIRENRTNRETSRPARERGGRR